MSTSALPRAAGESGVLITSEDEETLMRHNLAKTYGTKVLGFRVSVEHYRYLAEQVIALRVMRKREDAFLMATKSIATP